MKTLLPILLLLITSVSTAATYLRDLPDDLYIGTRLKIYPQAPKRSMPPTYMRFMIDSFHDSAAATLEIVFSVPNTEPNGAVGYHLRRDGVDLVAENYVQHSGHRLVLDLPALKADEAVEFLIGWRDSEFPYQRISARLTTEQGKTSASWTSRHVLTRFLPGS
ncbi:MAG TPA: hypothetical protein ENJ84_11615 [Gammaproteobacteria bacterium]|nr:hypothetical protein [Gammaproteobacteria bacterium]